MNEIKISLEEFKKKNIIYLDKIQDGFNKYPNVMLEGTEEYVNDAIRKLFKENGIDNSYADFYYGRLDQEAKNKVQDALNKEEIDFIESLQLNENEIFLRLNQKLLEILLKLTGNEVLFSSFYFAKYPCIVWGNYDKKYPIFFKDKSVMKIVMEEILVK